MFWIEMAPVLCFTLIIILPVWSKVGSFELPTIDSSLSGRYIKKKIIVFEDDMTNSDIS